MYCYIKNASLLATSAINKYTTYLKTENSLKLCLPSLGIQAWCYICYVPKRYKLVFKRLTCDGLSRAWMVFFPRIERPLVYQDILVPGFYITEAVHRKRSDRKSNNYLIFVVFFAPWLRVLKMFALKLYLYLFIPTHPNFTFPQTSTAFRPEGNVSAPNKNELLC